MSNSSTSSTRRGGLSFSSLLTLIFITLKLTGFITWSWWWVLSPLWIPAAVAIVLYTIGEVIGRGKNQASRSGGRR
jgi:hypothetical protein